MIKDFTSWFGLKPQIHQAKERPHFREQEVWFGALGMNVGFEQDGRGEKFLRPVIILKKFNQEIFLGIPLTGTAKTGKYYYAFSFKKGIISTAILSQVRLLDGKRLYYKAGFVPAKDFMEIKKRLKALF